MAATPCRRIATQKRVGLLESSHSKPKRRKLCSRTPELRHAGNVAPNRSCDGTRRCLKRMVRVAAGHTASKKIRKPHHVAQDASELKTGTNLKLSYV